MKRFEVYTGQNVKFRHWFTNQLHFGTIVGFTEFPTPDGLKAIVNVPGHKQFKVSIGRLEKGEIPVKVNNLAKLVKLVNGTADEDDMLVVNALIEGYPDMPIEEILDIFYNGDYIHYIISEGDDSVVWDGVVDDFIADEIGLPKEHLKYVNRGLILEQLKAKFRKTQFGIIKIFD